MDGISYRQDSFELRLVLPIKTLVRKSLPILASAPVKSLLTHRST
jgi:hypothetical protein